MTNKNNNKTSSISRKLYNPKAHTPAVYIPYWLIQVPQSKLSLGAKIVYGRLAQWANLTGLVHRSSNQLCHELGMSKSPVDRYLKELRDVGLIDTYQADKGGVNHFQFFDHEWMYEALHPNLNTTNEISKEVFDPLSKQTIPHTDIDNTPTPKQTILKEIKDKDLIYNKGISSHISDEDINLDIPKSPKKQKKETFGLEQLIANNPFNIETPLLEDWINVRKSKRAAITATAWKELNKTLGIIQSTTEFTAIAAFTRMVASGWQSLDAKWFDKTNTKPNTTNAPNTDDTSWGKDFYINNALGF